MRGRRLWLGILLGVTCGGSASDPPGFVYAISGSAVSAYRIDSKTGALAPVPGSSFPVPGSAFGGVSLFVLRPARSKRGSTRTELESGRTAVFEAAFGVRQIEAGLASLTGAFFGLTVVLYGSRSARRSPGRKPSCRPCGTRSGPSSRVC